MLTGDNRANAERLFLKYGKGVGSYVLARVQDPELAETITSRVFLTVVRKIDDCRGSYAAWLWSIVRSELARHFRDEPKHASLQPDYPSVDRTPPEELAHQELQAKLTKVLEQLSQQEQELIGMKFFLNLKNKDIAAALGLTPSNVGVLVYRTLKRMRQMMSSEQPSDPMIQEKIL